MVSAIAALPVGAEPARIAHIALTEAQRDRITAAAHFATAETAFQRGDLPAALRGYQRAYRWDPLLPQPLAKIAPLALSLNRPAEAVRYSLLDAETADPPLLRRLAFYQSEQQDWHGALRLYRLWLKNTPSSDSEKQQLVRTLTSVEVGRLEYLTEQFQAASRTFERIQQGLLENPSNSALAEKIERVLGASLQATWEIAGRSHLAAHTKLPDRIVLARQAFEQLAKVPENMPRADYWIAETLAAEGKPFEAYERLNRWFLAGNESLEAAPYQLLNELLRQLNDVASLETDLKRVASIKRPYAEAALAKLLINNNDLSGYQRFEALLRSDPSAPESVCREAAQALLRHYAQSDRLQRLPSLFSPLGSRLTSLDPLAETIDLILADAKQAERLKAILVMWDARTETERNEPAIAELTTAAWLARRVGSLELATKWHRELLGRDAETAPARALEWAIDLILEDRPEAAMNELEWGIEQTLWPKDDAQPYYYLSAAFAAAERFDAAIQTATQAARLEPDSADIAARLPWVLQQAGREREAIDAYAKLIQKFEEERANFTRESLRDARLAISYLTLQQGQIEDAVEWLEQVLDEFPNHPGASNDLAYLWADRGLHLRRAERMAQTACQAEPDNYAYRDTLGWVQYQQGDFPAALETINSALRLQETAGSEADAEILGHLASTLERLGRTDEAQATRLRAELSLGEPESQ